MSQPWSFGDHILVAPDVMLRFVGEESVLLNPRSGVYFGVDAVATRMWTTLTESETIQSAFDSLLTEYDVDQKKIRQDLEKLLKKLLEYELIAVKPSSVPAREKAE